MRESTTSTLRFRGTGSVSTTAPTRWEHSANSISGSLTDRVGTGIGEHLATSVPLLIAQATISGRHFRPAATTCTSTVTAQVAVLTRTILRRPSIYTSPTERTRMTTSAGNPRKI